MLPFGAGGDLIYRKARKMLAILQSFERLPVVVDRVLRALDTQTQVPGDLNGLACKMDDTLETLKARLGGVGHNN